MALKLPHTIGIEAKDVTRVRLILWSRESDFRETFEDFESRSAASDFLAKLAPFLLPNTLGTVEETTSFTFRVED